MRRIIILIKDRIDPDKERIELKRLLEKYRRNIGHLILRIDRRHIEVDIEAGPNILSEISRYLIDNGYKVVEEVDIEDGEEDWDDWKREFMRLYSQGRYWEIHEMLENIWRENGDCFIRALILMVIPYIKIQMGQYREAIRAYKRFLDYKCTEEDKYGIDLKCLKEEVKKLLSKEDPDLQNPIDIKKCIRS